MGSIVFPINYYAEKRSKIAKGLAKLRVEEGGEIMQTEKVQANFYTERIFGPEGVKAKGCSRRGRGPRLQMRTMEGYIVRETLWEMINPKRLEQFL